MDLPDFYFRVRENGATVFRLSTDNRQRRIDMVEIAVVNLKNGAVKAKGDAELTEGDNAAIDEWMAERKDMLRRRDIDDIHRTIDHLNLTTQWVQSKAAPDELEEITDRLLLAMHDLRAMLVRKKAERMTTIRNSAAE